jgi:rhodanese-related sulfurtransferase
MNKRIKIITTAIFVLFISFVVIFVNKSIAKNASMTGMPGMSENDDMEEMDHSVVHFLTEADLLKEVNKSDVTIVDLREPDLYKKGHVHNSINIPYADFQTRFRELDSNKSIILVCHIGQMGDVSGQFLLEQGFQHVSNLSGGMGKWTGPLEK